MCAELERRGYDVSRVDLKGDAYEPSVWKSPPMLDARKVFQCKDRKFDLVVHCAFHVGGRAAIDDRTNLHFLRNLELDAAMFEWAVETGQKHVLYFSSSAAYPVHLQRNEEGPAYQFHLREEYIDLDLVESPDANYGFAKLTGERMAANAREAGVKVTVVRPFSGYGADQSLDYPFPSIIRRAAAGDLSVWGPEGQSRDWVHISDVVNGSLAVVEHQAKTGETDPVNLCTGVATTMGNLMSTARMVYLQRSTGKLSLRDAATAQRGVTHDESKPTGVFFRVGDPTNFNKIYTPHVTIRAGVEMAVDQLLREESNA